ncbi:hypothetical protein ONZ45_g18922 [Pleurotus djamor]|nr:hypothetical protein ONZ45_g18922 [Pleurotus djamor]
MPVRKLSKSNRITSDPLTTNQLAVLARVAEDDAHIHLSQIKARVKARAQKCLSETGELDKETYAYLLEVKNLEFKNAVTRVMMNTLLELHSIQSDEVFDYGPGEAGTCRRAQLSAAFNKGIVLKQEEDKCNLDCEPELAVVPLSSSKIKRKKRSTRKKQVSSVPLTDAKSQD